MPTLRGPSKATTNPVFLIDTNVISEARKGSRADAGVRAFWREVSQNDTPLFLSAITLGELRRGVELIRHRGDRAQAELLEAWLSEVLDAFSDRILALDSDAAQLWGRLRVPHPHNAIDKQIAAIALLHQLTLVTRNTQDFKGTGIELLNPFSTT